jgi:hypothetical protein
MHVALLLLLALQDPKPAEPPKQEPPKQEPPKQEEGLFRTLAKKVTIGGQVRLRGEYRDPIGYANAAQLDEDDDIYLMRIRLNLTVAVTDDIDVFVQPQDSRTFGEEATIASNEKNLDLHQGWVEWRNIGGTGLTVKAGRQEMHYGDGRFVSPLDWNNIGRAWDGIKVRYAGDGWWVDGFFTVIKEGNGAEDDQDFYGLYGSYTGFKDHEIDAYVFGRRLADNSFTDELGNTGDVKDVTLGARLKGKAGGFDYSAEGAFQSGDWVDTNTRAWGVAVTAGYTIDLSWSPRIGAELTFATGDEDPTDGDRGTFDPLFPFGHAYQGYADVFAWKNGMDTALYLRVQPEPRLSLHLDAHVFTLDEERDAWYGATGAKIRSGAAGASRDIGWEIDLHVRFSPVKPVKIWAGWSHFFAGSFVEDTGRSPDMDWFFAQAVVEF